MRRVSVHFMIVFFAFVGANITVAQKPPIVNAKVRELSASSGLKAAVDSVLQHEAGVAWIGYRIPVTAKERTMCCFESSHGNETGAVSGRCCGCQMETERGISMSGGSSCSSPEPLPYAYVFLRSETKEMTRVRVYTADCHLDFAGLPLVWLEGVKPEESVELLAALALASDATGESRSKKPGREAIMAISLHDSPAADQALERLIGPSQPLRLREDVAFWLGIERGKKGLELLRKYVKGDPDSSLRKRGAFAFSQSKEPEALKELISMAHNDEAASVRGEAIFWLAQIGGRKEAEQITAAIENDPETEVKKKAVFALSQMRDGQGVPLLINLAKTHKNPMVRKEAIFWLGASRDPRALAYLEEILAK